MFATWSLCLHTSSSSPPYNQHDHVFPFFSKNVIKCFETSVYTHCLWRESPVLLKAHFKHEPIVRQVRRVVARLPYVHCDWLLPDCKKQSLHTSILVIFRSLLYSPPTSTPGVIYRSLLYSYRVQLFSK